MKTTEELYEYLNTHFPDDQLVLEPKDTGESWITVAPEPLLGFMKFLRDDPPLRFDVLMSLSGVHYPTEEQLGATYHVYSTEFGNRLVIKVKVPIEHAEIPSVESIWKTANWHEREAWDMVGIRFEGHPNHHRILCPNDWQGHPLKKDYEAQEFYQNMPTGE